MAIPFCISDSFVLYALLEPIDTYTNTHSKNKCWQTASQENDVISFNYVLKGAFIRGEKVNTETNEMLRNENNYPL